MVAMKHRTATHTRKACTRTPTQKTYMVIIASRGWAMKDLKNRKIHSITESTVMMR